MYLDDDRGGVGLVTLEEAYDTRRDSMHISHVCLNADNLSLL